MKVGSARVTWRQFNTPGDVALAEISQAGYAGVPWVKADTTPEASSKAAAAEVSEAFGKHNLVAAPGYLWADFWERDCTADVAWHAAVSRELGLDALFVSAGGFKVRMPSGCTRNDVAGRVGPEDGLTVAQLNVFEKNVDAAARAALSEGVKLAYHTHVGTVIESPAEVEWLVTNTDPEVLFLGPDTGHLTWGGNDVQAFFATHAERIVGWHAKDVNTDVMQIGIENKWHYDKFEREGVFTEVGSGSIDFARLMSSLDGAGFDGWVIAVTDHTAKSSALESGIESRAAFAALGV